MAKRAGVTIAFFLALAAVSISGPGAWGQEQAVPRDSQPRPQLQPESEDDVPVERDSRLDRPDTVRPNTTRPNTVRPDSSAPDTAQPDTTRPDTARTGDPRRMVVLIFNHGTRRPQRRHVCNRERDIPQVVIAVAQRTKWRVHYLCSTATDGSEQGSYTYKRAKEIERVVDAYRARGVPASRIFLLGHSAGAWSSLIAARQYGHKFNAVVAFAPAFAGPRYEVAQFPWWRNRIRPRQVTDILSAGRMRALVFAYPDDAFNRPRELAFLKQLTGVRLVTFDRCPERTHGTTYSGCFARMAAPEVERYIRARLAAKP
ncbi:MAG: alpha/beta fold hydrolase [Bauldia litoralis]